MSGMTTSQEVKNNFSFLMQAHGISQQLLSELFSLVERMLIGINQKQSYFNSSLGHFSQRLSEFVEVTTLLSKIVVQKKQFNIQIIKDSHIQLLFLMKGLSQSHQNNDMIAMEDLIKHELKDNLTHWKIHLLPIIKEAIKV